MRNAYARELVDERLPWFLEPNDANRTRAVWFPETACFVLDPGKRGLRKCDPSHAASPHAIAVNQAPSREEDQPVQ